MRSLRSHQREEGAVVVEFAVVFGLFVVLLSGIIQYGVIFAAQQSLSHASAEAARAVVNIVDEDDDGSAADEAVVRVGEVLDQQLSWLDGSIDASDTAKVDYVVQCADAGCDEAIQPAADACADCLQVVVTFDWEDDAVVPTIFPVFTPSTLTATANVRYQ